MVKNIKTFLNKIHSNEIKNFKYYTFGYQADYKKKLNYDYGYIPFITGLDFIEKTDIISPIYHCNRPGTIKDSTEYIVVHDTASGAPTATAIAHENWLNSMANDPTNTNSVSWHFTVDDKGIIEHLPIFEVGHHAGDGTTVKLEFYNTNVKKGIKKPIIKVSKDGYFLCDNIKTKIKVPLTDEGKIVKNSQLPTQGINYKIDSNDNILIGNTYWNKGFEILSNRGGNLNSVGIETCVNYGSDYTKTMRINAYLVAKLLIEFNLDIDRVKQHNSFSGKNCPMTMRYNKRWNEFIRLVKLNKEYLENYTALNMKFISLSPEYLDNSGKVIKYQENKVVEYKVVVGTKEYYYKSKLAPLTFDLNQE